MTVRRPSQAAAWTFAAMIAGLLLGTSVPPAAAAACDGTSGVTVVVDFGDLGGGVRTGCASGDPSSSLAALAKAGFSYTVAQRMQGYVCRIDGKPANDPCMNASPADAYWSFWHAPRGGSWSYAKEGAASYDPKPGTVDGWAFGAGSAPRNPPPAAARPGATATQRPVTQSSSPPAAPPPAARPRTSTTAGATTGETVRPAASTAGTPSPAARLATGASPAPTQASTNPAKSSTTPGAQPAISSTTAPGVAADQPATQGSTAVGIVAAVTVSLVLAGSAIGVARRRREET